jgi:hypothetical protein
MASAGSLHPFKFNEVWEELARSWPKEFPVKSVYTKDAAGGVGATDCAELGAHG